jgi:hypothetical protein
MWQALRLFWRWFLGRAAMTRLLVVLLLIATFMGCFGYLTPSTGPARGGATPTPVSRSP